MRALHASISAHPHPRPRPHPHPHTHTHTPTPTHPHPHPHPHTHTYTPHTYAHAHTTHGLLEAHMRSAYVCACVCPCPCASYWQEVVCTCVAPPPTPCRPTTAVPRVWGRQHRGLAMVLAHLGAGPPRVEVGAAVVVGILVGGYTPHMCGALRTWFASTLCHEPTWTTLSLPPPPLAVIPIVRLWGRRSFVH